MGASLLSDFWAALVPRWVGTAAGRAAEVHCPAVSCGMALLPTLPAAGMSGAAGAAAMPPCPASVTPGPGGDPGGYVDYQIAAPDPDGKIGPVKCKPNRGIRLVGVAGGQSADPHDTLGFEFGKELIVRHVAEGVTDYDALGAV